MSIISVPGQLPSKRLTFSKSAEKTGLETQQIEDGGNIKSNFVEQCNPPRNTNA